MFISISIPYFAADDAAYFHESKQISFLGSHIYDDALRGNTKESKHFENVGVDWRMMFK